MRLWILAAAMFWGAPVFCADRGASEIEAWQSLSVPDQFPLQADGSRARPGGPDDPVFAAQASRASLRLTQTSQDLRPVRTAPPSPSAAGRFPLASKRKELDLRFARLGMALGTSAALIGLGMIAGSGGRPPRPLIRSEEIEEAPRALVRAQPLPIREEPSLWFPNLKPTWRAISAAEQKLVDAWDSSPEKAEGRADLDEWLAARGDSPGVDVALLRAKLRREA